MSLQDRFDSLIGKQRLWLHIGLFLITFFTTTLAGVAWRGQDPADLENFSYGIEYSLLLLLFLSAHEFGHFIMARIHKVDATLPFYIPFPAAAMAGVPNFGTFGAVIRTRSKLPSRRVIFDIGVAGPIAGFIVCLFVLAIGFMTLPGIEYLQSIHPRYPHAPVPAGTNLVFGRTILYSIMEKIFAPASAYIPPMSEMYHYPMLCVGWFGLFVTSLNLLPVGQLDGGHTTYGLFSPIIHKTLGIITVSVLALIALPEIILAYAPTSWQANLRWLEPLAINGGSTWIFWVIMILLVIRFRHPTTIDESPLDRKRIVIGFLTLLIFVLSFTPSPLALQ
ncbi:MAG TPA: site-2 protease family protein [Candidatus Kapabacteria bacterium]|nr:site-2 protease family protein [Candidatus Kapabacteria bacterium]